MQQQKKTIKIIKGIKLLLFKVDANIRIFFLSFERYFPVFGESFSSSIEILFCVGVLHLFSDKQVNLLFAHVPNWSFGLCASTIKCFDHIDLSIYIYRMKAKPKEWKKGQLINENRTIIQYHKYRSKTNNSTCSNDFNETWKKKIQWHLNRTIAVCPSNGLEFVYFVYFYRRICWSKGMLLWLSVPNLNIAHETNTRGK